MYYRFNRTPLRERNSMLHSLQIAALAKHLGQLMANPLRGFSVAVFRSTRNRFFQFRICADMQVFLLHRVILLC